MIIRGDEIKMEAKRINENIIEVNGERYIKEESKGFLDIPELGISVELEVHDKDKSWNNLKLSKREEELLDYNQVIWLANSKYAKQLKMDSSSSEDDFFIKQPFEINKKKGYVARFCADSDGCYLNFRYDSDYSYSTLGVRFAKKISIGNSKVKI